MIVSLMAPPPIVNRLIFNGCKMGLDVERIDNEFVDVVVKNNEAGKFKILQLIKSAGGGTIVETVDTLNRGRNG